MKNRLIIYIGTYYMNSVFDSLRFDSTLYTLAWLSFALKIAVHDVYQNM